MREISSYTSTTLWQNCESRASIGLELRKIIFGLWEFEWHGHCPTVSAEASDYGSRRGRLEARSAGSRLLGVACTLTQPSCLVRQPRLRVEVIAIGLPLDKLGETGAGNMKNLIFLHNSRDLKQLQLLAALAQDEMLETGYRPWLDFPDTSTPDVATTHSLQDCHEQIVEAISTAHAICYFVGSDGPGKYQAEKEAELALARIKSAAETGSPIQFVPILLANGRIDDLPDWAQGFTIVNHDRTLRHAMELWSGIKQRLSAPAQGLPPPQKTVARPPSLVMRLREALSDPPRLSVLVGPYNIEGGTDGKSGPTAVANSFLRDIEERLDIDRSPLTWPSEAAEWITLVHSRQRLHQLLRKQHQNSGVEPSRLADSVAYLGKRWIDRFGERAANENDWHGLLILTTRIDLALEAALSRNAGIGFTRILPTLDLAPTAAERRKLVQQWQPDLNWQADLSGHSRAPSTDCASDEIGQLSRLSLDSAKRVVLVKLCGTLEVPSSLVVSVSDFFEHSRSFDALPKLLNEIMGASAHLYLGRGLASPLAQLVRTKILPARMRHLPRIWAVPSLDEQSNDELCDLELRLLESREQEFLQAFDASAIFRGSEDKFVRDFAAAL